MKAIINDRYGSPNILKLQEVARPEPKANEVQIKVLAASVNKADWHILNGKPFPVRLMAGFLKPKYKTLGADVSGIVEHVGSAVTQFKPGDEVFGDLSAGGFGGFAEYTCADEKLLARKPSNLSFEESASLPMAAVTALQGLRNKGRIQAKHEVLINGASGGVGSFAVQIAKALGAEVTAVCSTGNVDRAKAMGADHVIDYKAQDFTQMDSQYDLIFDVVGNHSMAALSRVLKRGGRYVACAFSPSAMLLGPWMKLTKGQHFRTLLASTNQADLQFICKLAEDDSLKPNIEQTYTLDDVPEAMHRMGNGGLRGKLVISI